MFLHLSQPKLFFVLSFRRVQLVLLGFAGDQGLKLGKSVNEKKIVNFKKNLLFYCLKWLTARIETIT
jgi:hypothetical protein